MKDSCLQFADSIGLPAIAKGSNFVFSPFSIRAALSLVAVGANGGTRDQLLQFLGVSTIEKLNEITRSLLESIGANDNTGLDQDDRLRISFANGIWVDESLTLKQSFQEVANSVYTAATKRVSFFAKPEEALEEVNKWIESKTNGLIKDIISPGAIDSSTVSIQANALYFKAAWLKRLFSTKDGGAFQLLNGTTIQIPFMSSSEAHQYIATFDHFKVLKLPYKQNQSTNHEFSMLIFLPESGDGINMLVQNTVTAPNFIISHVPHNKVLVGNFKVPKFKVSSEFEASKFLKELGLVIPFSEGEADFSEMVDERINLSAVIHGATINVDEFGTEASATTSRVFRRCCGYIGARVDFVVDHPFLFAIVEEITGAVLFMGHVVDPSN